MSRFCRLNLLLDLDQTLIAGIDINKYRDLPKEIKALPHFFFRKDRAIFARPGLQEFLDFCFHHFNVGVYTSAKKEYAEQILAKFIINGEHPERKLACVLDRRHQKDANTTEHTGEKNLYYIFNSLKLFNFYPCNTILLDNSESIRKAESNKLNTIRIPDFLVLNKDDGTANEECTSDYLLDIVKQVLVDINSMWIGSNECTKETSYSGCTTNDQPIFTYEIKNARDMYEDEQIF